MDVSMSFKANKKSPAPPSHEKSSWPELVGVQATLAATAIAHDRPDVAVEVLPPGAFLVPGANPKRVRVFINGHGAVAKTPRVG
ncbi:hypothetical protein BAE44_0020153 [Dichanthelium oligosanthes]|uniref:Subtilisin inhibitor 1 n=1 Tax=Dichanthelium oligosanthes TaxID=888268 RepID=A0A1E5V162_9POAL|nr:hypothetical protein BAE44_0020153 [Dichanthelium oligosanthes]